MAHSVMAHRGDGTQDTGHSGYETVMAPSACPRGHYIVSSCRCCPSVRRRPLVTTPLHPTVLHNPFAPPLCPGPLPLAGEILPAPIAQQLAGSKRRHSPIVWDPDSRDRDRDRTRASGDQGQGQGGPPAKRPATAPPGPPPRTSRLGGGGAGVGGGGLLERAAEELHAFRRQVALGELDYDPDAPAARKRSPSLSGDEEGKRGLRAGAGGWGEGDTETCGDLA